jgi:hypothetical protein
MLRAHRAASAALQLGFDNIVQTPLLKESAREPQSKGLCLSGQRVQ